jgi:hypothetical protein
MFFKKLMPNFKTKSQIASEEHKEKEEDIDNELPMFENRLSTYERTSKEATLPRDSERMLQLQLMNRQKMSSTMKRVENNLLSYSELNIPESSKKAEDSPVANESGDPGFHSVSEGNITMINAIKHQRETSKFFSPILERNKS